MKKLLFLFICSFFFSGISAQELNLSLTEKSSTKIFSKAKVKVVLKNTTDQPLIVFINTYKEYGAVDRIGHFEVNGKKTRLLEWGMDTNSRFSEKQFISVAPGKTRTITHKDVPLNEAGEYIVSYSFKQDPDAVIMGWAKDGNAKRAAKNMSKFEATGSFKFSVAPTEQKDLAIENISYEELKNKKTVSILAEAIANPSEAYKLSIRPDREGRVDVDNLAKLGELKNMRSLTLNIGKEDVTLPAGLNEIPLMELNLSSRGGKFIYPSGFGSQFKLRRLTINKGGAFPTELAPQPELVFLNLNGLESNTIPEWIGNLKKLEELSFWGVPLKEFPKSFANLTSLKKATVIKGNLTSFALILNNKELESLSLTDNKITSIPTEIMQLKRCTSFQIETNQLTSIPPEVYEMSSLNRLQIGRNQLTSMPDGIEKLTNLESLLVRENKLTTVPAGVLKCKKLTFFNGKENKFKRDKTIKALKKMLEKKGKRCLL